MQTEKKPTLLFISDPLKNYDPRVVQNYYKSIVTILEYDFKVISKDDEFCDIQELTDKCQPDLILFDCGQEELKWPLQIKNLSYNSDIPRIGFLSCDSHDPGASRVLHRFNQWDIQYFFAIDTSIGEVFPFYQDRLFYLPWSINPNLFYSGKIEEKTYDISLLGAGFFGARGRYPTW